MLEEEPTLTLSIPNLADAYAASVNHRLVGRARDEWLAGCARSSTLGLLWGRAHRSVLCPSPLDPAIVDEFRANFAVRVMVLQLPANLRLDDGEVALLAEKLRTFARSGGYRVAAWAWTTRLQALVEALAAHDVSVLGLEDRPASSWSEAYLDSKTGIRDLATRISPPAVMPPGFACTHLEQAFESARTLFRGGCGRAVFKADRGAGGLGQFIANSTVQEWDAKKRAAVGRLAPLLDQTPLVVEAWIEHSTDCNATPSAMFELTERRVNLVGTAATFTENEIAHAGAVVGKGALPRDVADSLVVLAGAVAGEAHALGYRGPLGLDAVVDQARQPWVLEVNPRRTMVSHCYSLRKLVFGASTRGAVASFEGAVLREQRLGSFAAVRSRLDGLWYNPTGRRGVFVTNFIAPSTSRPRGHLSLVGIGEDASSAVELIRQAFLQLSLAPPPSIEAEWRRRHQTAGGDL
jgi:hypothetical protein